MKGNVLLEDHEILARESNTEHLQHAYNLIKTDLHLAIAELENLASKGSVMSALYLAEIFCREPNIDLDKAKRWWRFAYERDSSSGLFCLAAQYIKQGNYAEAEKIYLVGKSKNDAVAMFRLAKLYVLTGQFHWSSPEVKTLLETAASLGHAAAMRDLWMWHMKGAYGILNIPKGIFLFFYFLYRGAVFSLSNHPNAYGPSDRRLR
jgi:tetratricopeptide (TPR) repeat protein